jgi:riboflavin kinase/FMN adenylyltransferase
MNMYRGLDQTPDGFGPSVLTIGNFDGVHLGHRRILGRVVELAAQRRAKSSVLTFDPHPAKIVAPSRAPRLLTTIEQRLKIMSGLGIRQAVVLPFTEDLAQLTPEEFVRRVLVEKLGVRAVLVGDNFRFGRGQKGCVETLATLGRQFGFETEIVPAVTCRGRIVSSSAVRQLVGEGRVSLARRFLGSPYGLEGEVVSGRGVGARQTVPTLNLATTAEVLPKTGVYITRTYDPDAERSWDSITNIGYRPTFGSSDELTIETFLLQPLDGDRPRRIRVAFLARVRDERKFESPDALKAQILRDVRVTEAWFRRSRTWAAGRLAPA